DGTQTAVVDGHPGPEEIFTDKYGRVKVRFHWDRSAASPANSSCWVRVGTVWAGRGYGVIHIPRRGQEVIVAFEEGDPDRPIIIGSVYNAEMMPPFALPAGKKQSGMVSASNQRTGGFNQISINDGHGNEQISIHAQKNLVTRIENDENHFAMSRSTKIDGEELLEVTGNYQEHVNGSNVIEAKAAFSVDARYIVMTGKKSITLKVGGSRIELTEGGIDIRTDGVITIDGKPVYINC